MLTAQQEGFREPRLTCSGLRPTMQDSVTLGNQNIKGTEELTLKTPKVNPESSHTLGRAPHEAVTGGSVDTLTLP